MDVVCFECFIVAMDRISFLIYSFADPKFMSIALLRPETLFVSDHFTSLGLTIKVA